MILEQRDSEEDMAFKNMLSLIYPNTNPHAAILLTCVGAENGAVLSLVTASVGFTMEGVAP